jgi:hypothetical protein
MWQGVVGALLAVLEIAGGNKPEAPVASSAVRAARDVQPLVAEGIDRSAIFRALAGRLHASDVVVYVRFGRCRGGVPACLLLVSARPAPLRLLIKLDRFGRSESTLIALLAHELQHANEVAASPDVTDAASFQRFFERHGRKGSDGFDTAKAQEIQRRVTAELIR